MTVLGAKLLVRVFLLDGSSKLLPMEADARVGDILLAMKNKLDLRDVSVFAILHVEGCTHRICGVQE
ncbi:hypothetical protein EON64_18015, partial [archaeon]